MYKTIETQENGISDDAKLLAQKKAKLLQEFFSVDTQMELEDQAKE
jgi:hypothetical protein